MTAAELAVDRRDHVARYARGALQVADVLTTNHALAAPGNWELNPIMAYTMAHWGVVWWLPKVALVGFAMATLPYIRRRWPLMVAVGFYVAIVANNSLYL